MDPFCVIPLELHSLIIQHFRGSDVIKLSEVSTDWHERIKLPQMIKKVKLSIKSNGRIREEEVREKIEVLKNSKINYKAVTIHCQYENNLSEEFWKFLRSRSSYIEELKIKSIRLNLDPLPLKLENLKVLKLSLVTIDMRNLLLLSTGKLTKLKLKLYPPQLNGPLMLTKNESSRIMEEFRQMNPNLEDVELHGLIQYLTFFTSTDLLVKEIENPSFQLKTLKLKLKTRIRSIPEFTDTILINFLKSQSNSLEKFFIDACREDVIKYVFNNMPRLTHLHLETMIMDEYEVRDLNLTINEKLEDLRIPYVNHRHDIIEFLSLTPNLKFLFVSNIFPEAMEVIATQLMQLRTLKFRYENDDCETIYERLKRNPNVNSDIELIWDYDYV